MTAMVAFDAFSQVLTNPLVAPRVFLPETFSEEGMNIIETTGTLKQLIARNIPAGSAKGHLGFTREHYHGP